MTNEQFHDCITAMIKTTDVDLSETFRRCVPRGSSIATIKETILAAVEEEYRSVDCEDDLYDSLRLDHDSWLFRFQSEFLNVLYIYRFSADQIKIPLQELQSVSLMEVSHG